MSVMPDWIFCPLAKEKCRENCAFMDEDGNCLVAEALCGIALLANVEYCCDFGAEVEQ